MENALGYFLGPPHRTTPVLKYNNMYMRALIQNAEKQEQKQLSHSKIKQENCLKQYSFYMSHIARKPVFGVSSQV